MGRAGARQGRRDAALELLDQHSLIRRVGEAGIPIIGYNFSIAGVAGRTKGNYARGEAPAVGMEGPYDLPMPNGLAWNMIVDPTAPGRETGTIPPATHEQLWSRLQRFLEEVIPVAEAAGVGFLRA